MTESVHPSLTRFNDRLARDRAERTVPEWMLGWLYKDQTDWIDFDRYRGREDLAAMFRWASWKPPVCRLDSGAFAARVAASIAYDRRVLARLGVEVDHACLHDTGVLNAMDATYCDATPRAAALAPRRVLDFGAGHGRQYNLLAQGGTMEHYLAMDATPLLYCAQRDYLGASGADLSDYVTEGGIDLDAPIALLPTWRHDLVPDASIDLAMAVEVLPELPAPMLPWVVDFFSRVLRPGGALYLRDQDMRISRNRIDVAPLLASAGFVLEFRPHLVNGRDLTGVPRVWRRIDPDVAAAVAPEWVAGGV